MRTLLLVGLLLLGAACSDRAGAVLPDDFLVQQMNVFYQQGPRIVQSYAANAALTYRGDVYDTSLTILHFVARCQVEQARPLADALLFLQDRDQVPDGRLHAAYWANNLLDPAGQYTSVMDPNISPGNMAWAGIALARFYQSTEKQKYLDAAVWAADWIIDNCKKTDSAGGFSGGLLGWDYDAVTWRSTEHNIDIFALGRVLYDLTGNEKWNGMAQHAQAFVQSMFVTEDGYYLTGTRGVDGTEPNPSPIPADAQSWALLAGIDDQLNLDQALEWLLDHLLITETVGGRAYTGVKFSTEGDHIMCEATAGVAMALWSAGRQAEAQSLFDSLEQIQAFAPNSDGSGVVATPFPDGAPTGYGSTYPNSLHVASTAWTSLALLFRCDSFANPLGPLPGSDPRSGRAPADYDCDCDVDLDDLALFEACASGPAIPSAADCEGRDFDNDQDVDQTDFSVFQRCVTGTSGLVNLVCVDE
ncbi:MAG: hypothetical protein GX616_09175 [Planctomycetes bacterium]|nr:hypothetical protein [Planctomycetota bacterium]